MSNYSYAAVRRVNTDNDHKKQFSKKDTMSNLPNEGLVRLFQIIGDKKKGIEPLIPIGRTAWWQGVRSGRFPKPIMLSSRLACWKVEDIKKLIGS